MFETNCCFYYNYRVLSQTVGKLDIGLEMADIAMYSMPKST